MKKITILLAGFSLLIFCQLTNASTRSDNQNEKAAIQTTSAALKISSSQQLYNLTMNWVKDFKASHPAHSLASVGIIEDQKETVENLSILADENSAMLSNPSNWKMIVGREVIVPFVSQKNPMLEQLQLNGVSAVKFRSLLNDPDNRYWDEKGLNVQRVPVRLYLSSDEDIQNGLQEFATTAFNTKDVKMYESSAELIEAVSADQFAIGFCKLNDLRTNLSSAGLVKVVLLPIDRNGNGRLDNFENIYASLDEFTHGVWIGKYPRSLSSNIYAVAPAKPEGEGEVAFLSWVLTDGQKLLNTNGFCDLTTREKQTNMASLLGMANGNAKEITTASAPQSWPVMLAVTAILGLFLIIFYYSRKRVESSGSDREIEITPRLIEQAVDVPNGLYFDKSHTWAFMEQDGFVRVGIDDFLQHITGRLTKIKMKESGEKVRKGETIMTIIQDGKQLNIYAPISGTILAHNELLLNDTGVINTSPFFKGWVYQIEPTNWLREAQFMLMGEKYREWLRDEFIRLKDFFASVTRTNELVYSHIILQDGGELSDNVLASLEPKIWEDFQTKFIDTSR